MKLHIRLILTVALLAGLAGAQAQTNSNVLAPDLSKVFKSDKEKYSYFLGMYSGNGTKSQIKRFDMGLDPEIALKGYRDALLGTNTLIPESEIQSIGREFQNAIRAQMEANAIKAKAEGLKFLENNKKQPGVVVLPSGLQYKVITEGTGAVPAPTDELAVNYVGSLPDGTVFDSSKPGKPLTTTAQGRIIQGWKQALQLMKVGAKWKVFIPTELAYGEHPPSAVIPANSPLVFEMELVSAQPPPPPAPAPPGGPHPQATPLTSDIIKVPSKAEMDKGAKVETIKAEDLEKARATNGTPNP